MKATNHSAPLRRPDNSIHLFHQAFCKGGGMEQYALTLAGSLARAGNSVVVHARKGDRALAAALGIDLRINPVPRFPRKFKDLRFFRQVSRTEPGLPGLHISLSRVCVRDVMICGGTHRGYMKNARKVAGPFDWLQMWMEQKAYHSARIIVSHSDLCAQELGQFYRVPASKIRTLYPPIEPRFHPPESPSVRAELRQRFGFLPHQLVFLFPSMGHSRKGLKAICAAMRGFSESIILAVAGKPVNRRQYPFVRYLGFVEDMVAAYQAADFTILGSYYEPFGMVGPESILCGTRLVFEKGIGCLPAINPEYVTKFSVWEPSSIRGAVAEAIARAKREIPWPGCLRDPLNYNASADQHATDILRFAQARC